MKERCPGCDEWMATLPEDDSPCARCRNCGGVLVSAEHLSVRLSEESVEQLFAGLRRLSGREGRPCPGCRTPFELANVEGRYRTLAVDVCQGCRWVWFDPGELYDLGNPRLAAETKLRDDGRPVKHAAPDLPRKDWIDASADAAVFAFELLLAVIFR